VKKFEHERPLYEKPAAQGKSGNHRLLYARRSSHTLVAMHERALMIVLFLAVLVFRVHPSAHAEYIEPPILAAIGQDNLGVFEIMLLGWDKKSDPNPVQLQVNIARRTHGLGGRHSG
jgi:hypothetical protein